VADHQPARHGVTGALKVEILAEGVHSGDASGLVPSSFRIMRQVLDRLEDSRHRRACCRRSSTGAVPASRIEQARATAAILGDEVWKRLPVGLRGRRARPLPTDHRPRRGAAQPAPGSPR
jgi:hypothetical protein